MTKFYSTSLLTLILCLSFYNAGAQCTNLFISEYIEGSSFNKALEIYNPTPNAVDLSNYTIASYNNGDTTITNILRWPAGTMLASGDAYVIAHPQSDSATIRSISDTTSGVTNFNGDDAVVLRDTVGGMDIDIIGEVGVRMEWTVGSGSTKEHTLVRKPSVNDGETDWAIGALGWESFPQNFTDSLGFHNINSCDPVANAVVSFTSTEGSSAESDGMIEIAVTLSDIDQQYTINVAVSGGSATQNVDFSLPQSQFEITEGETSLSIPVNIEDDDDLEPDETFILSIDDSNPSINFGNTDYLHTILDDDNPPTPPCEYPFFSEYIEGSGSNKFLEVYNPANAAIDLSEYRINRYNNGNDGSMDTSGVFYWESGTMLAPGEVYVIGNSSGDSLLLLEADTTSTLTFYNGDDALELEMIASQMSLDIIGKIGEDPGTNWPVGTGATSEYTLVRDPNVQGGQTNWFLSAMTWIVYPRDFGDSLGTHYMVSCNITGPCDTTNIDLSADVTDESTAGEDDGAIDLSVSGGQEPYMYAWTGPLGFNAVTEDLDNLTPGEYCVIVTDANDCMEDACFTVEIGSGPCDTTNIDIDDDVTHESILGAEDGAIDITVTGGMPPYSHAWTGPDGFTSDDEEIDNLAPGEYCLVVTDENGCVEDGCYDVDEGPDPCDAVDIDISGIVTDESETGENDGAIDITISGGEAPYDIQWSNGSMNEDISNLAPDNYTVVVEDANGCLEDAAFQVNPGGSPCTGVNIDITVAITNESAPGANDGAIDISVTGGTPPYSFFWNTGAMTEDIDGLDGGAYDVTVEDSDGCLEVANALVGTGTGINDIAALKIFNVYPNPASDYLQLELQFDKTMKVQVEIVDVAGSTILELAPESINSRIYTIHPDWPAGIYFLKVTADGSLAVEPVIITR